MWSPVPLTILQLQEKITSYFITKLNLTFPRNRTEPNPNNEGSFPSLVVTGLNASSMSMLKFSTTTRYSRCDPASHTRLNTDDSASLSFNECHQVFLVTVS